MGLLRADRSLIWLRYGSSLHRFVLASTLLVPFYHSSGGGLLWPLEKS